MTINNMARNEIWKPIYKGRYEASNLGNIRSRITKRVLKPIQTKSHKQLQVWLNNPTLGYREQLTLSHLIYNAFSGEGEKVNFQWGTSTKRQRIGHKDGNVFNNRFSNLYRY